MDNFKTSVEQDPRYEELRKKGEEIGKEKAGTAKVNKIGKTNTASKKTHIIEKDSNTNANVEKKEEENTKRNVPERNVEETENKMLIIDEDIKRKYKIESHEQLFAYDTAKEYNDLRSIGNYLKLLRKLGLPMFQRVKANVDEREGVKNKGAYFNTMARLELSEHVISDPDKNDKSKSDKKVDKKK